MYGDGNSKPTVDARARLEPKRGTSGTKNMEPFSRSVVSHIVAAKKTSSTRQRALSLNTPHEGSTTTRSKGFELTSMAHLQGMDPATKRDRVVRVALVEGETHHSSVASGFVLF